MQEISLILSEIFPFLFLHNNSIRRLDFSNTGFYNFTDLRHGDVVTHRHVLRKLALWEGGCKGNNYELRIMNYELWCFAEFWRGVSTVCLWVGVNWLVSRRNSSLDGWWGGGGPGNGRKCVF